MPHETVAKTSFSSSENIAAFMQYTGTPLAMRRRSPAALLQPLHYRIHTSRKPVGPWVTDRLIERRPRGGSRLLLRGTRYAPNESRYSTADSAAILAVVMEAFTPMPEPPL